MPPHSSRFHLLPLIGIILLLASSGLMGQGVGLDVAAGLEDWGIYFQIGEAF